MAKPGSLFLLALRGHSNLRGEESYRASEKRRSREEREMIRAVMVINTQGKPRLAKFYDVQVSPLLKYLHSIPLLHCPCPSRFSHFASSYFSDLFAISLPISGFAAFDSRTQPVEKQQELIRNVYGGSFSIYPLYYSILFVIARELLSLFHIFQNCSPRSRIIILLLLILSFSVSLSFDCD